ncbi:MAG: Co2+/Mg2+ efflux protein ApaG [Oceanicoccus sp.]|uniref:Co2+/Mg2+ efflux protein ApaG n=1 Tax=Oceanicoccus sp. TaxID=2691044 RepID=UPI00260B0370|nr:Co2+/Mg2+ efflux protein ApaG [Oceanicoccus sp.]MDG1772365.1 Co2+/Mg2+ efflux protein ApaG [Oceanicoccus sp.]
MLTDNPISVHVDTQYIPQQSSPEEQRFAFAYTITISNHGIEPVKLISRHWIITDGNAKVEEVRGDGVVGDQPIIKPGQSYRYTSGALLETAVGTMKGSYQMESASGSSFDAPIPQFSLIHSGSLH